ncbi:uncharacterized protein LOC144251279 [Urocitellus parryii]
METVILHGPLHLGENDQNTEEPFRVQSLEPYRQDQLRNELLPVICGRNLQFSSNVGLVSWDFIPTQQVLDLLFPSASSSFLGTWVNFYSEASHQPPGSLSLQQLLPYMWLLLSGFNLEHQAHHLLAQVEDGRSSQAEPESQADRELRVPADAKVYHGLIGGVHYDFLLRETDASKSLKVKPKEFLEPSVAVASRTPAAVSSSSAVAAGSLPQATQSNECCMRKVTSSSSSLLHSSEQVEDSRVVHVLLEGQSLRETKRIPVTFQETVTSLIRRALDQNLLQHEDVDNFELLYMMSEDEKIKVSDHSLVCLSMNLGIQYFILRKRPQVKGKEFSESTCKSSRPLSHKQVGDTCLIRVHLETQSPEMAKSVLVTCQDRAPVVIRSALDLHFLTEENPEDYELGQIISRRQKLRIPAEANVFYAKNPHKKSNFVLRKRSLSQKNDGWIQPQPPSHASKSLKVKPKEFLEPSVAVASRTPAAVSSSSAVAAGSLPQATQSNECCMRKVTSSSSSLLHSSEQVEDSRVVHVLLEGQSLRETKRIPVTFQETVTSLIRRALDQNLLQHEDVDNFELLYMMSEDEKIKVSDHSLVCLSMNLGIQYFILRKRPQVKGKEFSESTCKSSRPLSHKQVGDTCLIRVHLETQSPEMAKSVLVTCQDRAPVVIRSALDLHFLTEENPEDYELGQIISRRQKLRIPAEANVFYAKNPHKKSNFVLRKRSLSQKNDGWIQLQPS